MDDSSSDDDVQVNNNLSPKLGGKKLKLNDGSSQDSVPEAGTPDKQEENLDSGVSVDKSGSTCSDGPSSTAAVTPLNEVVNAGPSTSNIQAILLNIKKPRRERNYRKRHTPGRDSDSDTSRDSDDISIDGGATSASRQTENSDEGPEDMERVMNDLLNDSDDETIASEFHMGDTGSDNSTDTYYPSPGDTYDSDNDSASRDENEEDDENSNNRDKSKKPSVLLKERPKHNYVILRELMKRELDLIFPSGKVGMPDIVFQQKFYGSLHAVYRLKRLHLLNKHRGCVNAINFHPDGRLLASGSDDMNVIVWDWARNRPLQTIRTGHKSNVFQSKFLHLNARSQLNIVTCARDGQVRLVQCPPGGGGAESVSRRRLAAHARAAHKLHVCAAEPHSVLSAGEDGQVLHADVRTDHPNKLLTVRERGSTVPLYSVHGHPADCRRLCVAGRDRFVREYDTRRANKPAALYCPATFGDVNASKKLLRISMMHLTCAIYNHDGTEILGSYNDEDIYLFDTKNDVHEKEGGEKLGYTARFSGHRNSATFKGVAFFGPHSEYVISGSDCSYIYVWDKKTQAIVQWMPGDVGGVVNCIESHPTCPVLATSGLDRDIKIWMPFADEDPTYRGMDQVVRDNGVSGLRSPLFNDFLPALYSQWRERRPGAVDDAADLDANVCTAF